MFVVMLNFADKSRADELMAGHNAWIKQGFADGIFLLVGSLQPNLGGAVLAHNTSRKALEAKVQQDPFVAEGVVTPDIHEITPGKLDPRLQFLAA